MADLIKKIKIKKQDGTFTDYIPIGADAANVATLDGESVQLKLNKKPYYYADVASMKADTKLKAGDMAITLGYYEANDGGGAEYQIVNDSELVDDGGSVHNLNNGLKASLIIGDKVNVKQFGAKGNGVTNDTEAIQKVFDYIENSVKTNPFLNHTSIIQFDFGTYIVSEPLEMSILCKIWHTGNVVLKSRVENDTTLKISTHGLNNRYSGLPYLEGSVFEQGGIIDGIGKFTIQKEVIDTNNLTNTSVGLQIGDDSDSESKVPVARSYIRNVTISGFNEGLKISSYNLYIFDFENIICTHNTSDVVFGDGTNYNTGEKITFINCVFAQAYHGIDIRSRAHFQFINCSFDFLANAIILQQTQTTVLNFTGGHFEKFGNVGIGVNATEENTAGFGAIIYVDFSEEWGGVNAIFEGSNFYLMTSDLSYPLFSTSDNWTNGRSAYLDVNLIGCNYEANNAQLLLADVFITEGKVNINSSLPTGFSNAFMFTKHDIIGNLSLVDNSWTDNSKDTDGNNLALNNLGIAINCTNKGNGVNWSVDTANKVFDKSIKFTITDDAYPQILYTLPAHKDKVITTAFFKLDGLESLTEAINFFNVSCRFRFFTKNGTLIEQYSFPRAIVSENGYSRMVIAEGRIPSEADYFDITYTVNGRDSSNNILRLKGDFYYCGSIVNYVD